MRLVRSLLLAAPLVCQEIQQPLPFSHKQHAGQKLACAACHAGTGRRMGIAPAAQCMSCHRTIVASRPAIRELAKFAARRASPKWEQVYEVPDFVWFSHARHRASGCEKCHGPVWQRDAITREVDHSMEFCRTCHLQTKAKAVCGTCHIEK